MQLDLLKKRAEKISGGNSVSGNFIHHGLRVTPGLNFTCNGSITGVMVGADVRTEAGSLNDYPQVDVWRISDSVTTFRVDSNLTDIAAYQGDYSPDGVIFYNLSLTTPISFQSGDVLGVYQPPSDNSIVRMYFDEDTTAPYADFLNASNGLLNNRVIHTGEAQDLFNQHVLINVMTGNYI